MKRHRSRLALALVACLSTAWCATPILTRGGSTGTPAGTHSNDASFGFNFVSRVGPQRLKALQEKHSVIQAYLVAIVDAIRASTHQVSIPEMVPGNWQEQLRQFERIGYRADLWREQHPGHFVRLQVCCNIFCYNQISRATVGPTFAVADEVQDIRFDWFVETGDASLNQTIKQLACEKAVLLEPRQNMKRERCSSAPGVSEYSCATPKTPSAVRLIDLE